MKVLLIDNGTSLLPKLQRLIPGAEVTVKFSDVKLSDVSAFDLVVLSGGGPYNVLYDHDQFKEEIKIVRSGKPIIGICFGCELLAHAFGGELKELPSNRRGIFEIEITDEKLGPKNVKVYEGHRWAIAKLPEDFEVLAKSETGPEIIKHKILPIYGLQFHPENFIDQTEGDKLFLGLFQSIKERSEIKTPS